MSDAITYLIMAPRTDNIDAHACHYGGLVLQTHRCHVETEEKENKL